MSTLHRVFKKYENGVSLYFRSSFTCISYYVHMIFTFLDSGPRSGSPKSYVFHIPGHSFFLLCSYVCANLVFQPVHPDNLYNPIPQRFSPAVSPVNPFPCPCPCCVLSFSVCSPSFPFFHLLHPALPPDSPQVQSQGKAYSPPAFS